MRGNREIIGLSVAFLATIILVIPVVYPVSAESDTTTRSQTITFSIDRPDLWFEAVFPVNIVWNDYFKASRDDTVAIGYSLTSAPATATVTVPLSDYLGFIGVRDVEIPIPLGNTLIGTSSMSLTSLAGLPSWLASLDLTLSGTVGVLEISCSSGPDSILTDCSMMKWTSWSTKTVQVEATSFPGNSVHTTLSYTLSLGLRLTAFGIGLWDIIPSSSLASATGYPAVDTQIEVPEPAKTLYWTAGGVSVAVIAAVATVLVLLKHRKGGLS